MTDQQRKWRAFVMAWAPERVRSLMLSAERATRGLSGGRVDYEAFYLAARPEIPGSCRSPLSTQYVPEWAKPLE